MKYIASAIFVVFSIQISHAQITISTDNLDIPDYGAKLRKIVDEQIVNYRTVVEYKRWNQSTPDDTKPGEVGKRVSIHGKNLWISRTSILQGLVRSDINGNDLFVHILSPDVGYGLQRKPSGDNYSVNGHYTAWGDPSRYASTTHFFSACTQLFQPQEVKQLLEVTDETYEGRPTKRISILTTYGSKSFTHLDRTTYQHLYTEADKVFVWKLRGYEDGKSILKSEYRTEGGRLWPTRTEGYTVAADGVKRMTTETVFLEYAPYVPTADELDIEKQFGIKPIPHEPRPDSAKPKPPASRTRMWLYAVAGVLAATAIGIVAIRRRKKA